MEEELVELFDDKFIIESLVLKYMYAGMGNDDHELRLSYSLLVKLIGHKKANKLIKDS